MTKKIIHSEIEKALVKIWVNSELRGTGFFITPDGYLLTAYHCVKDYALGIKLETSAGVEIKAQLDEDNSLRKFDIAVLKTTSTPASHCIPIGNISGKVHTEDEIVVLDEQAYSSKISRFLKSHKIELSESVGQSGCPVFHYATKRIIGLTLGERQAICFTPLFAIWEELGEMSNDVAKTWDKHLRQLIQQLSNSKEQQQKDSKSMVGDKNKNIVDVKVGEFESTEDLTIAGNVSEGNDLNKQSSNNQVSFKANKVKGTKITIGGTVRKK
jgi:hypothetical protein